jgi:V/A-type H+-transporting ATPase subunit E
MDIQLQELIEKIKKDGIESASAEAARVKDNAQDEAKRIVEAARKEAGTIIASGKADAERSEKAGNAALEQASRNLILSFKAEIQAIVDKIVAKDTAAQFNEDTLKALIPDVVRGLSSGKESVYVIVSESQRASLDAWAKGALSAEIAKGLEVKAAKNLSSGFRIAEKDGSAYYDFSAASVADALTSYLNPRLAEIVRTGAKGI